MRCTYLQKMSEEDAEKKLVYAMPFDKTMKGCAGDYNDFQKYYVYNKPEELTLLPFAPPPMFSYAQSMLGGTFKVSMHRNGLCAGASRLSLLAQNCFGQHTLAASSSGCGAQNISTSASKVPAQYARTCVHTPAQPLCVPAASTNAPAYDRCSSTW